MSQCQVQVLFVITGLNDLPLLERDCSVSPLKDYWLSSAALCCINVSRSRHSHTLAVALAFSIAYVRQCFVSCDFCALVWYVFLSCLCPYVSSHACYRQWFHRVRHFSVWVNSALLALGTSVRGPNCIICMCVYVYMCVCICVTLCMHVCVFCPCLSAFMPPVLWQLWYVNRWHTPQRKLSPSRLQLLFIVAVSPSFKPPHEYNFFLLSLYQRSLYLHQ